MISSLTENAWRQSEDYFNRIDLQLQQRHEEILAQRAALMSGREAFYNTKSGLPEIFIGSDSQAKKRNDALFLTLQSIRHDLRNATQTEEQQLSRLRKAYLKSTQESMVAWIEQLREFKLRQVEKIGEDRWNADEDYQAIDAIIRYRPSNDRQRSGGSRSSAESPIVPIFGSTVAASSTLRSGIGGGGGRGDGADGGRQLAASVPDLSASHRSAASAASAPPAAGTGGGGGRSRSGSGASRLGSFLSSSWSNLRSRMARGGSSSAGGGARRQR